MRRVLMAALTVSMAVLPACAVRQVEATPPTVTYAYNDEANYDDIEDRADRYCEEQYDADAVFVDQVSEGGGYQAVFACQ